MGLGELDDIIIRAIVSSDMKNEPLSRKKKSFEDAGKQQAVDNAIR